MRRVKALALVLLTACQSSYDEPHQDGTDDESGAWHSNGSVGGDGGDGAESSSASGDWDGGDGDGGDGDADDSDSSDGSADSGDSDMGDTGVSGGGADGPGDGGSADADDGGDGVGDGDAGDDSSGDSSEPEMTFPGEPCDPFADTCIDGYFCHVDDFLGDEDPQFRCREFIPMGESTGEYGSKCAESRDCQGGLKCAPWQEFPEGDCDTSTPGTSCCIDRCAYDETCGNGESCAVLWWPSDLEDYLDSYGGVGICAAP